MKQIINAKGTNIYPGQVKFLWVAACSCGNKLVRAMKESGLYMYVGKERFACKQCGDRLQKIGKQYFKGEQAISQEQVWTATDFDKE